MTKNKRYSFCSDNVALNLKTPIMCDNKKLSIGEVLNEMNRLNEENNLLKEAIMGKIQYNEDLEKFAIDNGIINKEWARFDGYD